MKYRTFLLMLCVGFFSYAMDIPGAGSSERRRSHDLSVALTGTTPPNEKAGPAVPDILSELPSRERAGSFDLQRGRDEYFYVSLSDTVPQQVPITRVYCGIVTSTESTIYAALGAIEGLGRKFNSLSAARRDGILTALRSGNFKGLSTESRDLCFENLLIIKSETDGLITNPLFNILDAFGCIQRYECNSICKWGKVDWESDESGNVSSIVLFPPADQFSKRLTPRPPSVGFYPFDCSAGADHS